MGRRNRSSSFNVTTTNTVTTANNAIHNQDLLACESLLKQFVHGANHEGRTAFHRAVCVASSVNCNNNYYCNKNKNNCSNNDNGNSNKISNNSSDSKEEKDAEYNQNEWDKMDGLFLVDALATRMKEMDVLMSTSIVSKKKRLGNHNNNGNGSKSSGSKNSNTNNSNSNNNNKSNKGHFHQLITTPDTENGYTPLHTAILNRDMLTMLLLLKHATTTLLEREVWSSLEEDNVSTLGGYSYNNNSNSMALSHHPLRLLDGNLNNDDHNEVDTNYNTINDLTSLTDKEGLTPLQLLGRSSCGGLEQCRRGMTWRALRESWRRDVPSDGGQQGGGAMSLSPSSSMEESPTSSMRYRRRMISFGDDRDYDSLHYEIESDDTESNHEEERRRRGGSFSVHLGNDDDHSDDDVDNDLIPFDNVDFNALNNEVDDNVERGESHRRMSLHQQQQHEVQSNDYGCEVLTFGRADHCALGVPQLSSRIRDDYNGKGGKDDGKNIFASSSFDKTYKPRRVESFALGELRRTWSSSSSFVLSSSSTRGRRDGVDSPAVAVAASTHHTLVTTRSGQIYSFGLGKGGRLGLGDESHRPLPTRILGPLSKRKVASIAAAENHSLCSTSDGAVFAWGSNGFGQLGIHSSRGNSPLNQDGSAGGGSRLSPRRVEGELKHSFVVAVACGERHSVALTRLGEVYCWGDNKSGQLGLINVSETQSNGPRRVDSLWKVNPRRKAIAISAAAYSTLVLTMPPTISAGAERESSLASLPVNTVYGWGHGNHSPMRVVFPTGNSSMSSTINSNAYSRMICINPVAIACAKYHNVAITKDGKVYTWGLHSDSLGVPQHASSSKQKSRSGSMSGSSSSSMITSPQLVTGMLSENGGGNAVAVSASESHTAIVTSDGHLFTWGESEGKDVLGHKGVRWQPSPRRVKRVHRAVAVAAGKEHTCVLMGTTFPPLPKVDISDGPLSLQYSTAIEISRNVDMFNVIPLALVAYRFNCRPLINFCDTFIRNNLDGVLAVGMKNDFDAFLSSRAIVGTDNYLSDGMFHPFLHLMTNSRRWVYSGRSLLKQYESTISSSSKKSRRNSMKRIRKSSASIKEEEKKPSDTVPRYKDSPINVRSEESKSQSNKITVSTSPSEKAAPVIEPKTALPPTPTSRGKYYCSLCKISCPDNDSFTLHIHGRKHRNREMHAEAAEEKSVAESMMAMKRMQLIEKSSSDSARSTLLKDMRQDAKNVVAWGAKSANFSGGLSPMTPQKGKSFQDILKEEQTSVKKNNSSGRKGKQPPSMSALSTPAKTKSTIITSPSYAQTKNSRMCSTSFGASQTQTPTLGSFFEKKAERKNDEVSRIGASWGASPTMSKAKNSNLNWGMKQPATANSPSMQSSPKTPSFSEIQKEEEAFRDNEDHMCRIDGNQWFVQQRERAASIGEIQKQERQEQEMLDLIEEQKQIELAIMKSIQEENDAKKKERNKKKDPRRQRRKKKSQSKNSSKEKSMTPS